MCAKTKNTWFPSVISKLKKKILDFLQWFTTLIHKFQISNITMNQTKFQFDPDPANNTHYRQ